MLPTPTCRVCVLWLKTEQMHTDYNSSVDKKGRYKYSQDENPTAVSLKGRAPQPLPGQAFIVSLASYYLLHRMLLSTF